MFKPAPRLQALERQLEQIHGKVRQISLDAIGSQKGHGSTGGMVASARAHFLRQKLEPLLYELESVKDQIRSVEAGLDGRERIAHRLPRESRYGERQSIADGRRRTASVYQLLTEIVDDLLDIWGDQGPSDRELTDAAANAVKSGIKFKQELTAMKSQFHAVIDAGKGPQMVPAGGTVQNVSFEVLVLVAWLLTYALLRMKPKAA